MDAELAANPFMVTDENDTQLLKALDVLRAQIDGTQTQSNAAS